MSSLANLTWTLTTLANSSSSLKNSSPNSSSSIAQTVTSSLLETSSDLSPAAFLAYTHVVQAIDAWITARDDESDTEDREEKLERLVEGVEDAVIEFGAIRAEELGKDGSEEQEGEDEHEHKSEN